MVETSSISTPVMSSDVPRLRKSSNWYPKLNATQQEALDVIIFEPAPSMPATSKITLTVKEFDAFCNIPGVLDERIFCTQCQGTHRWGRDLVPKTGSRQLVCQAKGTKTSFKYYVPAISAFCSTQNINLIEESLSTNEKTILATVQKSVAASSETPSRSKRAKNDLSFTEKIRAVNEYLSSPDRTPPRKKAVRYEFNDVNDMSDTETNEDHFNCSVVGGTGCSKSAEVTNVVSVSESNASDAKFGRIENLLLNGFEKMNLFMNGQVTERDEQKETNDKFSNMFQTMFTQIENLKKDIAIMKSDGPVTATSLLMADETRSVEDVVKAALSDQQTAYEKRITHLEQLVMKSTATIASTVNERTVVEDHVLKPSVPGANWVEVTKGKRRGAVSPPPALKKSSVSKRTMPQDNSTNGFAMLNEVYDDYDSDVTLPPELVLSIRQSTPRHQVDQRLKRLKEAARLAMPAKQLQPVATGELTSIYVNRLYRTNLGNLRNLMKTAGVFMKNIKEVTWCGKTTLEVMTFKSYAAHLKHTFSLIGWNVVDNFDLTTPAPTNTNSDAQEITMTQAARHFARISYKRSQLDKDEDIMNYINKIIDAKGDRFKAKVKAILGDIERDPVMFFPFLNTIRDEPIAEDEGLQDQLETDAIRDREVNDLNMSQGEKSGVEPTIVADNGDMRQLSDDGKTSVRDDNDQNQIDETIIENTLNDNTEILTTSNEQGDSMDVEALTQ